MTAPREPAAPRPALPPSPAMRAKLTRSPLLIALDIDGTIAPIAATPHAAVVPHGTREVIEVLTTRDSVHVAFVTGRGAEDGRLLSNVPNAWVIGNHGIEVIDPTGHVHVDARAAAYASAVAHAGATLASRLAGVSGVIVEDKRWTLSIHYRQVARDAVPLVATVVRDVAVATGLRVTQGKELLELRSPVEINKGTAVTTLASTIGITSKRAPRGAVLYAGDDYTDEDAFASLRAQFREPVTVHVGPPASAGGMRTSAEYIVADTDEMKRFLEWLAGVR